MRPKWYNQALEELEEGEEIQKTYEIECEKKFGYLILTNQKLRFYKQEGFLRKRYENTFETKYDDIEHINDKKNRFRFTLTLRQHSHTYKFQSSSIPVNMIIKQIKERTTINKPISHSVEAIAQQID